MTTLKKYKPIILFDIFWVEMGFSVLNQHYYKNTRLIATQHNLNL